MSYKNIVDERRVLPEELFIELFAGVHVLEKAGNRYLAK